MINQVVTRVSLDSFREKSAGKRVVLLYPWTNYRNLFLSHYLADAKDGLLYYRIMENVDSHAAWLGGLRAELDDVLGGFGAELGKALDANAAPDALGEALASDLKAYASGPVVLFVDELDRVPLDASFNRFATTLVDALPDNLQIAFSSRLFHQQPWHTMLKEGKAVVLGTEYRQNSDLMFTVEDEPRPQVEIYALGRGHAVVNGQEITNWDGALPRNLFFYFVDNPLVTRDDIFGTFWPDLPVKEATNVFHVTKRKISERISSKVETEGNYELTQYTSGFYIPSDKVVRHYDAGDFQEAVELATATFDEREEETLYRRAIDLYKAPFLETMNMPWVVERRAQLKRLHAQALIGLARIHQRRDEKEEAVGLFVRALKETPEREDIHREVMSLYAAMGQLDDAKAQFNHLKAILKSKKLKPDAVTKELMASLNGK